MSIKLLETADDISPEIQRCIADCLDWFDDERVLSTEAFIDKLCDAYGGGEFDLEQYDNAAARRIMAVARELRRSF